MRARAADGASLRRHATRARWVAVVALASSGCLALEGKPPWWPDSTPVASHRLCAAPSTRHEKGGAKPGRNPDDIQAVVWRRFGALRTCYEAALRRSRTVAGRLTTYFVIGTDGSVEETCLESVTIDDDLLAECHLAVFAQMRFSPAPGKVTVTYPIVYTPSNGEDPPERAREPTGARLRGGAR